MAEGDRHSHADDAELIRDPELVAEREVLNGLKQFQVVVDMIQTYLDPERPFRFRPSHLQTLQRTALAGLSGYAGNWRPGPVRIEKSQHIPPDAYRVPELIEDLCDYVNENWTRKSPLHLAS